MVDCWKSASLHFTTGMVHNEDTTKNIHPIPSSLDGQISQSKLFGSFIFLIFV